MILLNCILQAQISGSYYLNNFNVNNFGVKLNCYIEFYKSGCYMLTLNEQMTEDQIETDVLSLGKYTLKNKEITLTDEEHRFQMKLLFSNDEIIAKQSYCFLMNKIFKSDYDSKDSDCLFSPNKKLIEQKQERQAYKQINKTMCHIYYGTYRSENNFVKYDKGIYETGRGYELKIMQEHKYVLYYKKILISEGKWDKNGNELALFDENLQHFFYVMVNKDGLISKYLPGDYKGCSLFLIK
jgi:hypothetical protein